MNISSLHIILYTSDQQRSTKFYSDILQKQPHLNVPGMTEFILSHGVKLGLMPENGIAKILGDKMPHPNTGNGIPRCELYFLSEDFEKAFHRALQSGATEISAVQPRDWGHIAGYVADHDGHIIAFAKEIKV